MKKILVVLILLLGIMPVASASLLDAINAPDKSPISVVVFMNKQVFADSKAVTEIRDVLKEKFKYAKSVAIFGDDQAKSPEFLEFVEKVQTDPLNEKGIKGISFGALAQYGRTTKSNYIVLIVIAPFNSQGYGYGDIKAQVSVLDVASLKNVECLNWYKEGASWTSGAKDLIKKVASDFNWSPPTEVPGDKKTINQAGEKKPSVVVILPDIILEKPEFVEKVRKTVSEKFKVSNVPIYVDDKPKSPEFLEFIGKVETDSAKQQTFILKKERLVEYGKNTNSNPVVAIVVSAVSKGPGFSGFVYHLKEDIFVVDAESNLYLSNVVYDVGDEKSRKDGIDYLMDKLQNEFKLL